MGSALQTITAGVTKVQRGGLHTLYFLVKTVSGIKDEHYAIA